MFQFPRRFPKFVNELQLEAELAVKVENPDQAAAQGPRKKQPPEWGRFGPRANKAARWAGEEGQIGELVVRRSGKVELRVNNDLTYEVSFLTCAFSSLRHKLIESLLHPPASFRIYPPTPRLHHPPPPTLASRLDLTYRSSPPRSLPSFKRSPSSTTTPRRSLALPAFPPSPPILLARW
jgi:hypothetical protein